MRTDDRLDREVSAIGDLSRKDLIDRWHKTYGCPPPKGINRSLLERSAAWHLQAARVSGLSAAARATLRAGTRGIRKGRRARGSEDHALVHGGDQSIGTAVVALAAQNNRDPRPSTRAGAAPPLAIGTRLMREWNGRMHVVDVTAEGIFFDGRLYRSLTAVAKRITGTHWSGPRFFGL
jgi:hypothetical protein